MKITTLCLAVVLLTVGCHAQVKVASKPETPPPAAEPAPAPAPEPAPTAGQQISLPNEIDFELNDSRIKQTPETIEALDKLADLMKKHPNVTKLRIEGHTDNHGPKKLNEKLSKARAEAVAKWLAQHEVDEKRLVTVGFGARRPLKPNDTEANRALNRRTEYYVQELDGKKVDGDGKSFEEKADQKVASGGGAPANGGGKSTQN